MDSVLKMSTAAGMTTKSINPIFTITLHQPQSKRPVFDDFWPFPGVETAVSGG